MKVALLSACLFVLGLATTGAPAWTTTTPTHPAAQAEQSTKSIAGTVSSIGSDGRSFELMVEQSSGKQTMQFVLDQNSQIQGKVTVGTAVKVEYVAMASQNVVKIVTAQA